MSVDGDSKSFWLPYNGDFDVKLIGNDTGVMDYTVSELDADSVEISRVNFNDVEVIENYEMATEFVQGEQSIETMSLVTETGEIIEASEHLEGEELRTLSVDVEVEGLGYATGYDSVSKGDYITLKASTDENNRFLGWYVDGNLIKTEQDKAGNVIVTTSVDDDKMSELFRPLYYSGRQEDNVGVGDRDAVKYFHIWSNCELLQSQMIKAREKESEIKGDRDEMYRFPFAVLISQKVDIEHVDSYVDRAEKGDFRIKDAKEYVKNMYPYLPPEEKTKVDKKRDDFDKYNAILEHFLDTEFGCEKNKNIFETTVIDRRRIANLALLDPGTNRGYGNSPFAVKRGSILRREIEGQYYFPCTKMVFLKEFDPETPNLTRWNKDDYMKHLYFLLNQFVDCFYDAKGKYIMEG